MVSSITEVYFDSDSDTISKAITLTELAQI